MKHLIKIISIVAILILVSCNKVTKEAKPEFNGEVLKTLVQKTLQGDIKSSNSLEGLFTFISADFKSYNKILVDSLKIDGKTYFSILVENQNPIYNLFAVIDKKMDLLIKDESLNGYLNSNWKKAGSKIFAIVNEAFKSKDVVSLRRTSYYQVDSLSGDLVFRQFTKITAPKFEAVQNIVSVSDTTINTEIIQNNLTSKKIKDVFRFKVLKNQYLSNQNKFDNIIKTEIDDINIPISGLQIADVESIKELLGLEADSTRVDSSSMINDSDFQIKLDNQWRKLGSYTISNPLKKEVKGFKFINTMIGAEISLFKLAENDSTENYFDKTTINQVKSNPNQRSSDEFDDAKNKYKLLEYNCKTKKIILILEAPKSTFENYRDIYENIFKSFKVKC